MLQRRTSAGTLVVICWTPRARHTWVSAKVSTVHTRSTDPRWSHCSTSRGLSRTNRIPGPASSTSPREMRGTPGGITRRMPARHTAAVAVPTPRPARTDSTVDCETSWHTWRGGTWSSTWRTASGWKLMIETVTVPSIPVSGFQPRRMSSTSRASSSPWPYGLGCLVSTARPMGRPAASSRSSSSSSVSSCSWAAPWDGGISTPFHEVKSSSRSCARVCWATGPEPLDVRPSWASWCSTRWPSRVRWTSHSTPSAPSAIAWT